MDSAKFVQSARRRCCMTAAHHGQNPGCERLRKRFLLNSGQNCFPSLRILSTFVASRIILACNDRVVLLLSNIKYVSQ